ncbi:DEAD/DEAH box helicase [Deinococcus petrolearius]|uniref:DEAD/DEAH box helicase n=1 Tax=Deinococcus petrolearius TaxID=1751295 RepID=A0ABW1DKW5_9DEIO
MLQLKEYQKRALGILKRYLTKTKAFNDAALAFAAETQEEDVWGRMVPYNPVPQLGKLPYVCLRIPTGGGKTLMAASSLGSLAEFVERSHPVVLWLAPSGAIVEQTLQGLQNSQHPYRVALEQSLGQSVTVVDVAGALRLSVSDVQGGVVIVSTIQAFRRDDESDLNVYKQNGNLQAHFQNLDLAQISRLEVYRAVTGVTNTPLPSLANLLRLHNPVVIVDEAHNARTELSFDTLARLSPSVIVEWTATPAQDSNLLYSVSASELAAEHMIKLPIMLETRRQREEVLTQAVAQQKVLENLAREEEAATGEHLRPIVLIQAEANRGVEPWTPEVVKKALIDDHGIPKDQIAIATGQHKDLEGIELSARSCPIRYVITVQALREGWDCPYAYILAGMAELSAGGAVEQLLGRVLRLPRAVRKKNPDLNRAYAFSVSQNFQRVANSLADSLVKSGFEQQEARSVIRAAQGQPMLLFNQQSSSAPQPTVNPAPTIETQLEQLPQLLREKLSVDESGDVVANTTLSADEREQLKAVFPPPAPPQVGTASAPSAQPSAPKLLEPFEVPRLVVQQQGLFEVLDEQHFLEDGWTLVGRDSKLTAEEFPDQLPEGQSGTIDVVTGRVTVGTPTQLAAQSKLLEAWTDWSVPGLVHWLDAHIPHPDLTPEEVQIYLRTVVQRLIDERGLSLQALVNDKFRLRRALEVKINALRKRAEREGAQTLFSSELVQVKGDEFAFKFRPGDHNYPHPRSYKGPRTFSKHYYRMVADFDSVTGGEGDEGPCAALLDGMSEVKYWVRNVANQRQHSFWLRTASGDFYPDFVALLDKDKVLVVEVKGAGFYDEKTNVEKRQIGELWERRGGGKVAFVMTRGQDWNPIYAAVQRLTR